MSIRNIQAIVINKDKILLTTNNDNSINRNSFITLSVDEDKNELDVLRNEMKKLLNVNYNITFKFSKEKSSNMTTFLIDVSNVEINKYFKSNNNINTDEDEASQHFHWVNLSNKNYYSNYEHQYIKLLLEECIKAKYEASWTNIIADVYYDDFTSRNYLNKQFSNNHRKEKDLEEGLQEKLKVIVMAFAVGILFNYFFVSDFIGVSAIIFVSTVIGISIYANYFEMNLKKKSGWILLIPIILLSLTYSIYNNSFLRLLNAVVIPVLITSYILIIRYDNIGDIGITFLNKIFRRIFPISFGTVPKFFSFAKEIIKNREGVKENSTKKNIIRGLIISAPLLLIIVCLLTSADMMFKYYLQNICENLIHFNLGSLIGHTFIIVIITLYTFGFLWSLKYDDKEYCAKTTNKPIVQWEPVTIITIIFVICIAYLLFSIIQFSYLYGGSKNILPSGFTYSEYARKGFFELVLVTLINFTILVLSIKFTRKDSFKIDKAANIAYTLLTIFTFNMLFSANYKMNLYERAFGFTHLRIFVQVFMLLVGILLIIVLLGIWIKRVPILKLVIIATMIVYLGLNYMNVDKIIAEKNIERYIETQKIDMKYIKTLSYDASIEIIKLLHVDKVNIRDDVKKYFEDGKKKLDESYDKWYECNYYRHKFLKLLEQNH